MIVKGRDDHSLKDGDDGGKKLDLTTSIPHAGDGGG